MLSFRFFVLKRAVFCVLFLAVYFLLFGAVMCLLILSVELDCCNLPAVCEWLLGVLVVSSRRFLLLLPGSRHSQNNPFKVSTLNKKKMSFLSIAKQHRKTSSFNQTEVSRCVFFRQQKTSTIPRVRPEDISLQTFSPGDPVLELSIAKSRRLHVGFSESLEFS